MSLEVDWRQTVHRTGYLTYLISSLVQKSDALLLEVVGHELSKDHLLVVFVIMVIGLQYFIFLDESAVF